MSIDTKLATDDTTLLLSFNVNIFLSLSDRYIKITKHLVNVYV